MARKERTVTCFGGIMNTVTEFWWGNLSVVDKTIEKLTKRARKLGVPFEVSRSKNVTRREEITSGKNKGQILEFGEVSYSLPKLSLPDWRLLGVLTPIPTENNETIILATAVPGEELPEDIREWELRCDHCKMKRYRKETFILQHSNAEIRQVGRQCIRDYLGHDAERIFMWFDFIRDFHSTISGWGYGGIRTIDTYQLSHVLMVTSAIIRGRGWKSKKMALETASVSTADLVMSYLFDMSSSSEELRRDNQITDEDESNSEKCLEFWKNKYNDLSDYVQNAKLLAENNVVIKKAFGLAVSLLPVWQKYIADETNTSDNLNEYVGTIGQRREFKVRLISRRLFESEWGAKYLVSMEDMSGRSLIWWATAGSYALTEAGETFIIKGTVKDHKDYKGKKQTILSRVNIVQ